jgi:hypothetical protein
LKVEDENSRIEPEPDLLVIGTDLDPDPYQNVTDGSTTLVFKIIKITPGRETYL